MSKTGSFPLASLVWSQLRGLGVSYNLKCVGRKEDGRPFLSPVHVDRVYGEGSGYQKRTSYDARSLDLTVYKVPYGVSSIRALDGGRGVLWAVIPRGPVDAGQHCDRSRPLVSQY